MRSTSVSRPSLHRSGASSGAWATELLLTIDDAAGRDRGDREGWCGVSGGRRLDRSVQWAQPIGCDRAIAEQGELVLQSCARLQCWWLAVDLA